VLSGTGLCNKLITDPGESYRLCCNVVCDLEDHGPPWGSVPQQGGNMFLFRSHKPWIS